MKNVQEIIKSGASKKLLKSREPVMSKSHLDFMDQLKTKYFDMEHQFKGKTANQSIDRADIVAAYLRSLRTSTAEE